MLRKPGRALRRLLDRTNERTAGGSQPPGGRPSRGTAKGRRPTRATPPNAVGVGPLVAAPGLRLAVVLIVKNEASYIEEWLAYHCALGVDHVFLYDNGSEDDLGEVLERWVNHGLVTRIHWPLPGSQVDAYHHALRFFGPSVDWMGFFDVDEFLVPLVDDDILTLLARFPDAADVRVPRREFGFSGHRTRPEGLVIEAYTGIADVFARDPEKGARVKTLVQPRGVSAVGIHTATVADAPLAGDEEARPTRTVRAELAGVAQFNHYYTRSLEEFEAKRFRGSGTGRIARPPVPFDLPTLETDTSAHRFIPRTLAMLERVRSLESRPYRYGSQLRLAQFPRFNDLGLFAEFAVANVVAGLAAPRREPVLRIQNVYEGMGFLAEIGSRGHRPRPGDISGSVHMPQLVEHLRGRLELLLSDVGEPLVQRDGQRILPGGDGPAALRLTLAGESRRRCYAVGFELGLTEPADLEVRLVHDDGPQAPPLRVRLDAAGTWAGVMEVEDSPRLVSAVNVTVASGGREIEVHDLFLISYG
jgi:hypothetical protein